MSAEKAKQYTTKPVWVAASVLTSDPYSERNPTMFDINTCTRNAAKEAYDKAGIGPEDLDMVELHDCFATAELIHYENLFLCGEGEAGKLIDDKETYNGGKIPVNVSGGLLSKGHPLGATGARRSLWASITISPGKMTPCTSWETTARNFNPVVPPVVFEELLPP